MPSETHSIESALYLIVILLPHFAAFAPAVMSTVPEAAAFVVAVAEVVELAATVVAAGDALGAFVEATEVVATSAELLVLDPQAARRSAMTADAPMARRDGVNVRMKPIVPNKSVRTLCELPQRQHSAVDHGCFMTRTTFTRLTRLTVGVVTLAAVAAACGSSTTKTTTAASDAAATTAGNATTTAAAATTTATAATTSADDTAGRTKVLQAAGWGSNVKITISGTKVQFESDGIPSHEVLAAYLADGKDGKYLSGGVKSYSNKHEFPLVPIKGTSSTQTGNGAIGVAISGAVFFNPYESRTTTTPPSMVSRSSTRAEGTRSRKGPRITTTAFRSASPTHSTRPASIQRSSATCSTATRSMARRVRVV
jgi:hypothetical protein